MYFANRYASPAPIEQLTVVDTSSTIDINQDSIQVLSWNIGYAGMDATADFFMDNGTQFRPASRTLVEENLESIIDKLLHCSADVLMIQETARKSWLTRQIDVQGSLEKALSQYTWTYSHDLLTRWLWWPLYIEIGNSTAALGSIASAEKRQLPQEPDFILGMFRKEYNMHILRLAMEPQWVFINIHLSAFDSVEHSVREQQLAAVLDFALQEYQNGNHVVVGGDWNLRLAPTTFPHATAEKDLFWIRDLPDSAHMPGWKWAIDPEVPTVRTANQPYEQGVNYRLIIDGFLVSPNVEVLEVHTLDLGFEHTDHHPVQATLRVAPNL